MSVLVIALALSPLSSAQASLGNPPPQVDATLHTQAPQSVETRATPAPTQAAMSPRRSRMVEAGDDDRPVMNFSAMYREVGRDDSKRDNCLKGTGTRLRREADGIGACALGNGQVWVPER